MSISEEISYCEYCKGILLTEKELTNRAHESCIESVNIFHNSLASNIEYFRLDQQEYDAILELEELNSYLSDESLESNGKVLTASIYNNQISTINLDLAYIFKIQ